MYIYIYTYTHILSRISSSRSSVISWTSAQYNVVIIIVIIISNTDIIVMFYTHVIIIIYIFGMGEVPANTCDE